MLLQEFSSLCAPFPLDWSSESIHNLNNSVTDFWPNAIPRYKCDSLNLCVSRTRHIDQCACLRQKGTVLGAAKRQGAGLPLVFPTDLRAKVVT